MEWDAAIDTVIKHGVVDCNYFVNLLVNTAINITHSILIDYSIPNSILFHNFSSHYLILNYSSSPIPSNSMINFVYVSDETKHEYLINIDNSGAYDFRKYFIDYIIKLDVKLRSSNNEIRIRCDIPKPLKLVIQTIYSDLKLGEVNLHSSAKLLIDTLHHILGFNPILKEFKFLKINNTIHIYLQTDLRATITIDVGITKDGYKLIKFENGVTCMYGCIYPKRAIEDISLFCTCLISILTQ